MQQPSQAVKMLEKHTKLCLRIRQTMQDIANYQKQFQGSYGVVPNWEDNDAKKK